jgi:hypothetical protein
MVRLYQAAEQAVQGAWSGATTWLSNQAAVARAEIYKFVCETADYLSTFWESAIVDLKKFWDEYNPVTQFKGATQRGDPDEIIDIAIVAKPDKNRIFHIDQDDWRS